MDYSMYRLIVLSISFSFIPVVTLAASIEWELRHPFRVMAQGTLSTGHYFRDYENVGDWDWSARRQLYYHSECTEEFNPILCSEIIIGPQRRELAASALLHPEDSTSSLAREYGTDRNTSGWLADAYLRTDTRYSSELSSYYAENYYTSDRGSPFPFIQRLPTQADLRQQPRDYDLTNRRVSMWLDAPEYADRVCRWFVDGTPITKQGLIDVPCSERMSAGLLRGTRSSTIRVEIDGLEDPIVLRGEETRIDELVILSLGDSYSSGEGAPDFAAVTELVDGTFRRVLAPGARNPKAANAAHWLERSCHRSFLAAPSRAAIHYAAENPRTEVIHIHLGCSGAEGYSGVVGTYSGALEWTENRGAAEILLPPQEDSQLWRTTLSQINQAILLLCAEPEVDEYRESFNAYFDGILPQDGIFRRFRQPETVRDYFEEHDRLPDAPRDTISQADAEPFSLNEIIDCPGGLIRDIDIVTMTIGGNDTGFMSVVDDAIMSGLERFFANLIRGRDTLDPREAISIVDARIPHIYDAINEVLTQNLGVSPDNIIVSTYPIGTKDENNNWCEDNDGLASFNLINQTVFSLEPRISADESRRMTEIYSGHLNAEIARVADTFGWRVIRADSLFDGHGWCAGDQHILQPGGFEGAYADTDRWLRTPDDGTAVQNQLPTTVEGTFETEGRPEVMNRLLTTYGLMHPNGLGFAAWGDLYYREFLSLQSTPPESR